MSDTTYPLVELPDRPMRVCILCQEVAFPFTEKGDDDYRKHLEEWHDVVKVEADDE